ncbi:Uncharacterized protein TCM_032187 [Theobroma cacao]|uniref:Uncharacterized protein n=1 Tax=Theobroma cacao TaxID=3641 RepID=A0A061FA46_THECC|nr:Uncharacterized protein TCM_032187 [Theobroma cacao]
MFERKSWGIITLFYLGIQKELIKRRGKNFPPFQNTSQRSRQSQSILEGIPANLKPGMPSQYSFDTKQPCLASNPAPDHKAKQNNRGNPESTPKGHFPAYK